VLSVAVKVTETSFAVAVHAETVIPIVFYTPQLKIINVPYTDTIFSACRWGEVPSTDLESDCIASLDITHSCGELSQESKLCRSAHSFRCS
jgi:hypothetical protein